MNLNLHTWKEFEMERLFDIKKVTQIILEPLIQITA